jgi:hypothetical protein
MVNNARQVKSKIYFVSKKKIIKVIKKMSHRRFILEAIDEIKELNDDYESRFLLALTKYTHSLATHLREKKGIHITEENNSGIIKFPCKRVREIFCNDIIVQFHLVCDDKNFLLVKQWMSGFHCHTFRRWFLEIKRLHDTVRDDELPPPDIEYRPFDITTKEFFASEISFTPEYKCTLKLFAYMIATVRMWRDFPDVPVSFRTRIVRQISNYQTEVPRTE